MAQRKSWASYVIWGSIAVCAVLAAAFTIAIVVGAHRGMQFASLPKKANPPAAAERPATVVPPPAVTERDIARVNDALRDLAAERDRLVLRIEQLERTIGDITASIKERDAAPVRTLEKPAEAAPVVSETATPARTVERVSTPPAPATTGSVNPTVRTVNAPLSDPMGVFRPYVVMQPPAPVPTPAPPQAPMQIHNPPKAADAPAAASGATRTEFAVDLGGETTIEALRALWSNLRGTHGQMLDGLRPLVSIREGTKPGTTELRLIAGPLANAGAAARTCAALQARGANCQTAVFEGQRLALR